MAPMTRTITLVLLGGAALASCCCLLRPPPPPPTPPTRYDENGNPLPADSTTAGTTTTHRRASPFWVPLFWGGSTGRAYSPPYRPGAGSPSRSASPSPGGAVTRGGFGGTGKAITSGAAS
jgi:hypothetical protein